MLIVRREQPQRRRPWGLRSVGAAGVVDEVLKRGVLLVLLRFSLIRTWISTESPCAASTLDLSSLRPSGIRRNIRESAGGSAKRRETWIGCPALVRAAASVLVSSPSVGEHEESWTLMTSKYCSSITHLG